MIGRKKVTNNPNENFILDETKKKKSLTVLRASSC